MKKVFMIKGKKEEVVIPVKAFELGTGKKVELKPPKDWKLVQ